MQTEHKNIHHMLLPPPSNSSSQRNEVQNYIWCIVVAGIICFGIYTLFEIAKIQSATFHLFILTSQGRMLWLHVLCFSSFLSYSVNNSEELHV